MFHWHRHSTLDLCANTINTPTPTKSSSHESNRKIASDGRMSQGNFVGIDHFRGIHCQFIRKLNRTRSILSPVCLFRSVFVCKRPKSLDRGTNDSDLRVRHSSIKRMINDRMFTDCFRWPRGARWHRFCEPSGRGPRPLDLRGKIEACGDTNL